jgi:predicted component of viral defense system (DUF524 family)
VRPQRRYERVQHGLRSLSFQQRPDIAIEIERPGGDNDVWLFDPKYKLDSEELEGEDPQARPKKVDIDAMHSYRDAIRDERGNRVVRYAAILYPDQTQMYMLGLAALRARLEDSWMHSCANLATLSITAKSPRPAGRQR